MTELQWVDVEQGSDQWHELRRTKRPASMSSWITGTSVKPDVNDAIRLYREGKQPEFSDYVKKMFAEGHRLEAIARPYLETELRVTGEPRVGIRGQYLASFDFVSDEVFVDIKCPYTGKDSKTWKYACRGEIEPKYRDQLETQGYVYGRDKRAGLFVFLDPENYIFVPYKLDDGRWAEIDTAWNDFFARYIDGNEQAGPVELTSDLWKSLAEKYSALDHEIKALEEERSLVRAQLEEIAAGRSVYGAGISLSVERRVGSIDYKAACSKLLSGVDLEPFRKEPVSTYKLTYTKEKA